MHPVDCPEWEYEHSPNHALVALRCIEFLKALRSGHVVHKATLLDTRGEHGKIFLGTTPARCNYFAGHYRGEGYRCLEFYGVKVAADPRVGADPRRVVYEMANLSTVIINPGLAALKAAFECPDSRISPEQKLHYLVVFCCKVLEEFLRIHPYANGNGHTGRLIVWVLLAAHGYWPQRWPLDESPPYSHLLTQYRNRVHQPLEDFVLKCISG